MIYIKTPNVCVNEQSYIFNVILFDFLGLSYKLKTYDGHDIEITRTDCPGKITLDASFFHRSCNAWMTSGSMPSLPLANWATLDDDLHANLTEPTLPILYGTPGLIKKNTHWHLNVDILGSVFFMLSRYEELITIDRDKHGRFPSWASIAAKAGFLERPLADEYIEVFWSCLIKVWPDLIRKKNQAKNFITCDVDWPFDPSLYSLKAMLMKTAMLCIRKREILTAIKVALNFLRNISGFPVKDLYRDSISMIMDINENAGNKVAFYFIWHHTSHLDTNENFNSNKMRELFREISTRGHEIGVHPGYNSFDDVIQFKKTIDEIKRIFREEGIHQSEIGGRQHFLRWDSAITPILWEGSGLNYDSTLSYADKSGFRCGTSHEFTMYDLVRRSALKLKQRPLIIMECTIIASRYENLGYRHDALERFELFKERSHQFGGTYTLLWHNSHFENVDDIEFYKKIVLK